MFSSKNTKIPPGEKNNSGDIQYIYYRARQRLIDYFFWYVCFFLLLRLVTFSDDEFQQHGTKHGKIKINGNVPKQWGAWKGVRIFCEWYGRGKTISLHSHHYFARPRKTSFCYFLLHSSACLDNGQCTSTVNDQSLFLSLLVCKHERGGKINKWTPVTNFHYQIYYTGGTNTTLSPSFQLTSRKKIVSRRWTLGVCICDSINVSVHLYFRNMVSILWRMIKNENRKKREGEGESKFSHAQLKLIETS